MKIAITTPSGHVGSAVVDCLMDFGGDVQVKLIARRPKNLESFIQRGAELVIGLPDDATFLTSATRDVDTLFWVTPPGFGSDNVRAFQNRFGKAAAFAVRYNRIPRVVNLSSIGAHLSSGTGPISGLYDVEGHLNDVSESIMHLRPGFFFENLFMQVESIRKWGRITMPLSGSVRCPMIATRDIGRVAAELLVDMSWTGQNIRELHGPADLSSYEVADILSKTLGMKIVYVRSDPHQFRHILIETGMSENLADLLLKMYDAMECGRLQALEPRTLETTTPTTLAEFAHDVLLPMVIQPVS